MSLIPSWIRAFFPQLIDDSDRVFPPRGNLKVTGVTFADDPANDTITMSIVGADTTIDGDVQGTLADTTVTALSGATPGSSDIGFPVGNVLRLSPVGLNNDTSAVIDTSFPTYICFGSNDGSDTDNLQLLGTCDQVIVGTLSPTGVVSYLGPSHFFGISFADADQPLAITIGTALSILARTGTIATSLNIGWLGASTTGSGHPSSYFGQDGMQSGDDNNGGPVYFFGGKKHGTTGLKLGVFFAVNGDPRAAGEIMIETSEVVAGQRYVAMCRGAAVTTTQMPANTGDRVIYVADAAVDATAAPVSGSILQSTSGKLKTISANLAMSDIGRSGTVVANCAGPKEQKLLGTAHNVSSQTFDFAIPTDRYVHLKAAVGISSISASASGGFLQAEAAIHNKAGTLSFIAALSTSANPIDVTDSAFKAATLEAADAMYNSIMSGEASAVWTISGTNARLTVTTPGGAGDYTVFVDTKEWGSL